MDQRLRVFIFYISVVVFFVALPWILLYSFGYKLDIRNMKLAKTGLIYIDSTPQGAKVYLDGRDLKRVTPLGIDELLPGNYNIYLELEGHYPWRHTVSVKPGETAYLDTIIFFPKQPYLDKINIADADSGNFYVFAHEANYAYCITKESAAIYRASLNNKDQPATLLCDYVKFPSGLKDLYLSPDKEKLLFTEGDKLHVIYLPTARLDYDKAKNNYFVVQADGRISRAFWFTDSGRVIVVTDKTITVYELFSQGKNNTVKLLKLRDNRAEVFYDVVSNMLYFTDIQKGSDDKMHRGLYRLDLSKNLPLP